jgi:hypothetical protein
MQAVKRKCKNKCSQTSGKFCCWKRLFLWKQHSLVWDGYFSQKNNLTCSTWRCWLQKKCAHFMRLVEIIIIELEPDYSSENLSFFLIVLLTYRKNNQSVKVVIVQNFLRSLKCVSNFNCCLSVHVDNYTIIIPTKCTSFLLLKTQDITICTFVFVFLVPTCFSPRGSSSGGAMSVPS